MSTVSNAPIRRALKANALFSALSGITLISLAQVVADSFALSNPIVLQIIGTGLLFFVLGLLYIATRPIIKRRHVQRILFMDLSWVVASIALLLIRPFGLSNFAHWEIAFVALIVASLAYWQYRVLPAKD